MATYEFKCIDCGKEHEFKMSFSDYDNWSIDERECPSCGSVGQLLRIWTPPGIQIK